MAAGNAGGLALMGMGMGGVGWEEGGAGHPTGLQVEAAAELICC